MATFEVGKTYWTRSICDYDSIYSFTILARTAKTVTVKVRGKTVRRGVQVYDSCEQFKPFGTYSMCAVISADKMEPMMPGTEALREHERLAESLYSRISS